MYSFKIECQGGPQIRASKKNYRRSIFWIASPTFLETFRKLGAVVHQYHIYLLANKIQFNIVLFISYKGF